MRKIYLKYILKIIFIHKHEWYVMFGRSGMMFNVDFRDIWKLEPLQKFGFWNMFMTSKNRNFLFWLSLPSTNVRQIYDISTVYTLFKWIKIRRSPYINPLFVSWELALWLRWWMSIYDFNVDTIFEEIFINNKYFLVFLV